MKSLGIIGYGHFGQFLADKLQQSFDLKVYSASNKPNPWSATLEAVAACDYVILSIPLAKHIEVCKQLRPLLGKETVIVDVCSVKESSGKAIRSVLGQRRILSTHPLFGPESASDSLQDHVIVVCPDMSDPSVLEQAVPFFTSLGLQVVSMVSRDHDKEMALVYGLTFYIARILKDFNLDDTRLQTPSFKKLIDLAHLEQQHTKELFITIQKGNPYTEAVRAHFIDRAQELQDLLAELPALESENK